MRRDRTHLFSLKTLLLIGALVLYQFGTSLYPYLSPLLGIFFAYAIILKKQEEKTLKVDSLQRYFVLFYVVLIELNKGFYLFSTLIFFLFFYTMVVDWIKHAFKCRPCILAIFVASGYIGIYLTNNLLAYIMNIPFYPFSWEYGLYIVIDTIIAIVLFRDRML